MAILRATYIIIFFSLLSCCRIQGQTASGVVNYYRKVKAIDTAKGIIQLYSASNLTQFIGHNVMLIQMKGATMDASGSSGFGNITLINNAGRFEIGRMCGQLNDSIVLENKIQNFYDVSGLVQLVFMPLYSDVTINGNVKAAPWNAVADTGGIVALEATGTITLNASISADSAGFRGGALMNQTNNCTNTFPATAYYYSSAGTVLGGNGAKKGEGISDYVTNEEYGKGKQVNGGGGGNILNTGGGGGGGYGPGGNGGFRTMGVCSTGNAGLGGIGLASYGFSTSQFRIFMGGGGGAGQEDNAVATPGGNGGGIVYIKCNQVIGSGHTISANGNSGYNPNNANPYSADSDGGGGGGGGGVVILQVNTFTTPLTVQSKGGNGSNTEAAGSTFCSGPGGGGGGGFVWSTSVLPANVTVSTAPGASGIILTTCAGAVNGAAAGSAGSFSAGFTFPALKDSSPLCKQILPFRLINSFSGNVSNSHLLLTLELNNGYETEKCLLQNSIDGVSYNDIQEQRGTNKLRYYFTEDSKKVPSFYRVKIITRTGGIEYSGTLYFKPHLEPYGIALFPDPMINSITMRVKMPQNEYAILKIRDAAGRIVYSTNLVLQDGEHAYNLPLGSLHSGVYNLQLVTKTRVMQLPFVHL